MEGIITWSIFAGWFFNRTLSIYGNVPTYLCSSARIWTPFHHPQSKTVEKSLDMSQQFFALSAETSRGQGVYLQSQKNLVNRKQNVTKETSFKLFFFISDKNWQTDLEQRNEHFPKDKKVYWTLLNKVKKGIPIPDNWLPKTADLVSVQMVKNHVTS